MITGIDHVVILADDLTAAMRRFEALGFAVERGGSHPGWGTENALIPLADGSYLELLAAPDPTVASQHRFWQRPGGGKRMSGEYGGFALASDDLAGDLQRIRGRGLALMGPQEGSRARLDGQIVRWKVAFPERPDLPFLIEDQTPRVLRISTPARGLGAHAAVEAVVAAVADLTGAARAYEQLLGEPAPGGIPGQDPETQFQTPRGRITLTRFPANGASGVQAPGVSAVALRVGRWDDSRRGIASVLQPQGDRWLIAPASTGGARVFLRAMPGG